MKTNLTPGNDTKDLEALYQLQILDTAPEKEFDDIAVLAARLCNAPIAIIGFADAERFWFKARYGGGPDFREIPGGLSFCQMARNNDDLLVVEDTASNAALSENQSVIREQIRFIASAPIKNDTGQTMGYLCVFDHQPRTLTLEQADSLRMLAGQAGSLLKLRLQLLREDEEEYRAAEGQMRTIFYHAIDAVVVTDERGIVLQWNPKATELFGWEEAEMEGHRFTSTCLPSLTAATEAETSRTNTEGQSIAREFELNAVRKNGSEFEVALAVSPALIKERLYFIYFVSDVTNEKAAARELDKQKEFYENILNNIPADIAVFDADHRYLFVNPTAIKNEEFRKYIIGKDDFEYARYRNRDPSMAEKRRAKFLEAKESGKEIRWEDSLKGQGRTPITHLRRMFPVYRQSSELYMMIGFGMDITERKEMEERQAALLKQLSVQNTQLADFCNIVSHNLRAPLANIAMLMDFIDVCDNSEEQKELVSHLNPVIENLNTTFNELVESIQVKQDLEIQCDVLTFQECYQRTYESLETEIKKTNAIWDVNFQEAPAVYFPPKYIYSIFHNLMSNALKYRSPERPPHIQVTTSWNGNNSVLCVKDNGLGIDLERHGNEFFKIGKVFHHHPNAKGFGLYMIKTHIESMGGRIWVESMPDQGAAFFVEFTNQQVCKA